MKKNQIILWSLLAILGFSSCIYIDDDEKDNESFISISIKTPSNDGSITSSEKLALKISVNDDDGVEKVFLRIPNLNIDKFYNTAGVDIEINEVFIIKETDIKGLADILVKVKDDNGNTTRKTVDVIID